MVTESAVTVGVMTATRAPERPFNWEKDDPQLKGSVTKLDWLTTAKLKLLLGFKR